MRLTVLGLGRGRGFGFFVRIEEVGDVGWRLPIRTPAAHIPLRIEVPIAVLGQHRWRWIIYEVR